QRWQRELGVTVPSGVQVQEELGDGPLQLSAGALEDGKPRAGQFRRRFEIEHRQIAPPAYLRGGVLRVAVRAAVLGQVRDLQQQRAQLIIELLLPVLNGRDLRLQGPAAFYQLAGALAALGRCLHFLRDPLGLCPRAFNLTDRGVAPAEQAAQLVQVQLIAAPGQPAHGVGGGVEQYARIVHQYVLTNSGSPGHTDYPPVRGRWQRFYHREYKRPFRSSANAFLCGSGLRHRFNVRPAEIRRRGGYPADGRPAFTSVKSARPAGT